MGRKDYSEADRVLAIYTRDFGKISYLAKGVRRPVSRKRGALEVFSRVKFSAVQSYGLDLITETETVESFSRVRKDLKKVAVAYFFVETVGKITREEEKNEQLYLLLVNYLEKLGTEVHLKAFRERFIYDVLVLLGFWRSGKSLGDADRALENVIEKKLFSVRVGKKII